MVNLMHLICLLRFLRIYFTYLQTTECGWITSRQIEAAVLLIMFIYINLS